GAETGNGEQGMEAVPLVAAVVPEVTVPPEAKAVPVRALAPAAPAPAPAPRKLQAGTVMSSVSTLAARAEKAGTGNGERGMVPESRVAAVAPEVASTPVLTEAAAPAKTAVPPPVDPKVLVERMRLAEKRMAQVTAYLSAKPGAAPLWNDPQ